MITEEQNYIVKSNKSAFISSTAGSGKSFTLAHTVAEKVKLGANPENIYIFSFSKTATSEIKEKIKEQVGKDVYAKINISTIHAFIYRIIAENVETFKIKPVSVKDDNFYKNAIKFYLIDDNNDGHIPSTDDDLGRTPFLKTFLSDDEINEQVGFIFDEIHLMKSLNREPSTLSSRARKYYQMVTKYFTPKGYLTFLDLLYFGIRYLKQHENLRKYYADKIKYAFIDESQDTIRVQVDLFDLLLNEETHIMCFGDIKQTLYRFANADPFYFINWITKRNLEIINLSKTFRYSKLIADVSQKVVNRMHIPEEHRKYTETLEKNITKLDFISKNILDNANTVINIVQNHINDGIKLDDINILYRWNRASIPLQKELIKRKIPFFVNGNSFLSRIEIKLIIDVCKAALNCDIDSMSNFASILGVGIDNKTLNSLVNAYELEIGNAPTDFQDFFEYIHQNKIKNIGATKTKGLNLIFEYLLEVRRLILEKPKLIFSEIIEAIHMRSMRFMDNTNFDGKKTADERIEFVQALEEMYIDSNIQDLNEFFNYLLLEFETINDDKKKDKVYLGTIHSSKGCTMSHVILITEGMLEPFDNKFKDLEHYNNEHIDEYFCLFVGITRAKNNLSIVVNDTETAQFEFILDTDTSENEKLILKKAEEVSNNPQDSMYTNTTLNYNLSKLRNKKCIGKAEKLRETDKAIYIKFDGRSVWCVKSQLGTDGENMYVSYWMYDQWRK